MGSYADRLKNRMRHKRQTQDAERKVLALGGTPVRDRPDGPVRALTEEEVARIGDVHAQRYPQHDDPRKGQMFGGECNTTACSNRNAVFFNRATYGLYCPVCTNGLNGTTGYRRPDPVPVAVRVQAKPTLEEMEEMRSEFSKAFQAARAA